MEIYSVFVVLTFLGLLLYFVQVFSIRQHLKTKATVIVEQDLPPVSILKPLKGLEDNLFDNLESFCKLDYPRYEVIFSLQDRNDPAYKVACMVKQKHPECDISIVVEYCNQGLNPKINNLIPAYKVSKYEFVLISDSNVMVGADYLKSIVSKMADPSVGLVTNLIRGIGGRSFGAIFENLHLNAFIIGSVCFLDKYLGIPCVIGKSMLMKKSDLTAIGGFSQFKDVLAEDFIIGRQMKESGKKVVISEYMIQNVNEYWSLKRFLNRHTRWGKLRWKIGGYQYISELLCNPVFMSAVMVISATGERLTALSVASIVSFIKMAGDYYVNRLTLNHQSQKNYYNSVSYNTTITFKQHLLVPIKDIIVGLIWFVPLISSKVDWRGNKYIIGKDSRLYECDSSNFFTKTVQKLRLSTNKATS
ncbi:MAG: ceramide glucosyltransferase [Thermodesulfovibrionales bacterium]|nr:ceramide glucosyltransferase [Thermodesulfovibrionales bacterium]